MRIGDVNKDNYKMFLAMLGVKNTKALDNIMGTNQKTEDLYPSEEEVYAKLVRMGRVEEGMLSFGDSDTSWRKIVPVSDDVKDKIIATVRKQFLENGNGLLSAEDGDELGKIMKEYRKSVPANERLSVTWTLNKIYVDEARRLTDYVKSKNPTWNLGQQFDKNILQNSNFGENGVDVRA
jgi:hypothetical protein